MVEYKQFYTESSVSAKLCEAITSTHPKHCLELSAGEGALITAILEKHPEINVTAVDIDIKNVCILERKFPSFDVICGDSTSLDIYEYISDGAYDIALCNPPFKNIPSSEFTNRLLIDMVGRVNKSGNIRAEIVFLLINLMKLKFSGELAIILPDMFLTSLNYVWLRKYLVDHFVITKVIECEHKSFKKTEAKTHIFHIVKNEPKNFYGIEIRNSEKCSIINYEEFLTARNQCTSPLDFDGLYTLFRGRLSGKECKFSGMPYFHSTSYSNNTYSSGELTVKNDRICVAGDILIARVGTRVIGSTLVFNGSAALVSDCIFCLRIENVDLREFFLKNWYTERRVWLAKNSKGTCAKNISLSVFRDYVRNVMSLYHARSI